MNGFRGGYIAIVDEAMTADNMPDQNGELYPWNQSR